MDGQYMPTPAQLADDRRRCWSHEGGLSADKRCKRTARLEWCGWRFCLRHFWSHKVSGQSSWAHLWTILRTTEIARHKRQ